MKYALLTIFVLLHLRLGADVKELSFQQLAGLPAPDMRQTAAGEIPEELNRLNAKQVRIRGFLYPSLHGGMILAAEPDLKSCCAGSRSLVHRQIALRDLSGTAAPGRAQLIEGTFFAGPVKDREGRLLHLYSIENAVILNENKGSGLLLACGIVACACIAIFALHRSSKTYGK